MFPVFTNPLAVEVMVSAFVSHIISKHGQVDTIVALDARGFLFGPIIALRLGAKFVPVRKAGKVGLNGIQL